MAQQLFFPVSATIASIQKTLQDSAVGGYTWDVATELLPLLNDGCAEIVNRDDTALIFNEPFQVAPFYASIAAVGSGYAEGDTITLAGGTNTSPAVLVAAGVNATTGALDMVAVKNYGSYTAYPSNPVSQASSSGAGTGATFNLTLRGAKQELPPAGASLVKITRNLGADGQTPGVPVTHVPWDDMDACQPTWQEDVCGVSGLPAAPVHYLTDSRDPKRFYLWPHPNVMTTPAYVELVYRAVPDTVGLTDNFPLPALYEPLVKYYVIGHALLRMDKDDARYKKALELATMYLKLFDDATKQTEATTTKTVPRNIVNRP